MEEYPSGCFHYIGDDEGSFACFLLAFLFQREVPVACVEGQVRCDSVPVYLENRIVSICESVEGVEKVSAIVTLSGGFEAVYATEVTASGEDYVILGSGSNASGLLLLQKTPEIVGIGIVCSGAESIAVRTELISLVSASFHLPTNRIYVTEAKK